MTAAKIDPMRVLSSVCRRNCRNQFDEPRPDQEQRADGHRHLAHLRWIIHGEKPSDNWTDEKPPSNPAQRSTADWVSMYMSQRPQPIGSKEGENGTEDRATHHRNELP